MSGKKRSTSISTSISRVSKHRPDIEEFVERNYERDSKNNQAENDQTTANNDQTAVNNDTIDNIFITPSKTNNISYNRVLLPSRRKILKTCRTGMSRNGGSEISSSESDPNKSRSEQEKYVVFETEASTLTDDVWGESGLLLFHSPPQTPSESLFHSPPQTPSESLFHSPPKTPSESLFHSPPKTPGLLLLSDIHQAIVPNSCFRKEKKHNIPSLPTLEQLSDYISSFVLSSRNTETNSETGHCDGWLFVDSSKNHNGNDISVVYLGYFLFGSSQDDEKRSRLQCLLGVLRFHWVSENNRYESDHLLTEKELKYLDQMNPTLGVYMFDRLLVDRENFYQLYLMLILQELLRWQQ